MIGKQMDDRSLRKPALKIAILLYMCAMWQASSINIGRKILPWYNQHYRTHRIENIAQSEKMKTETLSLS